MTDEQFFAYQYWSSLRAAAQLDPAHASARFGVDISLVELAAGMSIPDVTRLALEVELIILRPIVNAPDIERILGPSRASQHSARIWARLMTGEASDRPRASNSINPTKSGDTKNGKPNSKARR